MILRTGLDSNDFILHCSVLTNTDAFVFLTERVAYMHIELLLLVIAFVIAVPAVEAFYCRNDRAALSSASGWKIHTTFDGRTIVNLRELIRSPKSQEFQRRMRRK